MSPRPDDVRPRSRPRIFFESKVEANNYDTEANCLLLLEDIQYKKKHQK